MQFNNPFGDNYPFIGPPMDDPSVEKCVYDIYITYYEPTLDYKLPLSLVSIVQNVVTIADSQGNIIFSMECSTHIWGESFKVMEGVDTNISVALVVKAGIEEYYPDNGELCIRCVYTQPKHITSFTVDGVQLGHNLTIDYGYNIEYSQNVDYSPIRPANLISISANPGAGLGLVPTDCTQARIRYISSINGVLPDDNGSIFMSGIDATKWVQSATGEGTLADDTTPCCKCADFSYLATVVDKHIHKSYKAGAQTEIAKNSMKDLMELLSCGNIDIVLCKKFYPLRLYIDTTWPRHVIITVEFRNILPANVTNLEVEVTAPEGSTDNTVLRSFVPTEVIPGKALIDAQTQDNDSIVYGHGETFSIDWSRYVLPPGITVWSSVRVRVGDNCKADSEPITVRAKILSINLEPTGCVKEDCLTDIDIEDTVTAHGAISGGYGWNDPSGQEPDDSPTYGSGTLDCMLDRVYEICKEEEEKRKEEEARQKEEMNNAK